MILNQNVLFIFEMLNYTPFIFTFILEPKMCFVINNQTFQRLLLASVDISIGLFQSGFLMKLILIESCKIYLAAVSNELVKFRGHLYRRPLLCYILPRSQQISSLLTKYIYSFCTSRSLVSIGFFSDKRKMKIYYIYIYIDVYSSKFITSLIF